VLLVDRFLHAFGERVQHPVAGTVTDHEVIGERSDIFDVDKNNIFTLFIFQGIDNGTSQIESVQSFTSLVMVCDPNISLLFSDAENRRV
jgi:hypothetical protein